MSTTIQAAMEAAEARAEREQVDAQEKEEAIQELQSDILADLDEAQEAAYAWAGAGWETAISAVLAELLARPESALTPAQVTAVGILRRAARQEAEQSYQEQGR